MNKKRWGKSILYYCPVNKKVWQHLAKGNIIIYNDMPTYGLKRKIMEEQVQ